MQISGFPLITLLLCCACTGAVDSKQIRKGNHSAPDKYKIAEDCNAANDEEECKVIISYPSDKKGDESR